MATPLDLYWLHRETARSEYAETQIAERARRTPVPNVERWRARP